MTRIYDYLPEIEGEEMVFIQNLTSGYTPEQMRDFATIYRSRRKDPQMVLLLALLGLFFIAGIQRFMLGQIGMGLLYVFTGGLCLIGTIVDIVNYKSLAFDYNRQIASEVAAIIRLNN
ncbi:MAG: TM2 domain-containing protein [Lentimicrobiaceae bacterium]|jgi:TM2 domain-containing membrane protein YozV|nr:TM2 domain-containing protein [Lentimicrobiaceae bacterium]